MSCGMDSLWEIYEEWLQETCNCNLEEDECTCKSFYDWFDEFREDSYCGSEEEEFLA